MGKWSCRADFCPQTRFLWHKRTRQAPGSTPGVNRGNREVTDKWEQTKP